MPLAKEVPWRVIPTLYRRFVTATKLPKAVSSETDARLEAVVGGPYSAAKVLSDK